MCLILDCRRLVETASVKCATNVVLRTLHIVHYTLHSVHYTLHSVHYTLHSVQCIPYITHCTPYITHRTPYITHCTPYNVHRTQYIAYCTPYSVHYTPYAVHRTSYAVHRILHSVHCTLYNVHCTLYTVRSAGGDAKSNCLDMRCRKTVTRASCNSRSQSRLFITDYNKITKRYSCLKTLVPWLISVGRTTTCRIVVNDQFHIHIQKRIRLKANY